MVPPEDGTGRSSVPVEREEPAESAESAESQPSGAALAAGPTTPPGTRSDGFTWLVLAFVGFLAGQVAGYLLTLGAAALTHHSVTAVATLAAPPEWYVVSSLVGVWIGFGLAPVVASRLSGTGRPLADLGIAFRPIDLLGLPIGAAAQYALWALYYPFRSDLHDYNAPVTKLTGSAHGGGYALIAVLTVVVAPLFEEVFFRGLLLRALVRMTAGPDDGRPPEVARRWTFRSGLIAAVVVDGVLFAAAHAEFEQFAGLALFGMLLAFLSLRTGRQGMNIVTHGAFNLVTVALLATAVH